MFHSPEICIYIRWMIYRVSRVHSISTTVLFRNVYAWNRKKFEEQAPEIGKFDRMGSLRGSEKNIPQSLIGIWGTRAKSILFGCVFVVFAKYESTRVFVVPWIDETRLGLKIRWKIRCDDTTDTKWMHKCTGDAATSHDVINAPSVSFDFRKVEKKKHASICF